MKHYKFDNYIVFLVQQLSRRLFRAIDCGEVKVLRQYTTPSQKRCVNKCGHTFLHRALLKRNHDVIDVIMERYPELVSVPDNVSNPYKLLAMDKKRLKNDCPIWHHGLKISNC